MERVTYYKLQHPTFGESFIESGSWDNDESLRRVWEGKGWSVELA